ncbi:SGNH/GDSL hydrolase family protein [Streptomyces gardneri]|uniref:SGNH/GDSL hydrolase family protein n=1 Tax=Nocardia TaxID=1817 RepID=UPI00135AF797|nr:MULTISPECIES: SGNH/GDSL hydrolase family protein [Nocardia]MBF6167616.1 SGNH/GDSL hydrolase family protein [Streptomyces gardneri]MBF6206391.1 SGNH/GDSL hydrolase family protein [Streptomyces gardneri]UAK30377.1 SGNH/GDSL hydrolase family protein [Nocardia asteroides]
MTNLPRAVLVAACLIAAGAAVPADAASTGGAEYVALGDSGAATTGVRNFDLSAPPRCLRSTANTPKLIARELGLRLDDRTCNSARIPDLTAAQGPGIPPQFDALGPGTRLVTVHIGANDALMAEHVVACHVYGLFGAGTCAGPDWDADIDAIAGSYATALQQISIRSPKARIVVDGWPRYVRDGGCPDLVGLRPSDAAHVQAAFDRLNTVVARAAAAHGATYVDTRVASEGRDACAPAGVRWIDPVIATETLIPYHLTPQGMRGVADVILPAIRAAGLPG